MATSTIQLSQEVKRTLTSMKLHPRESFNEVLERVLEDLREVDDLTKKEIDVALREIREGKFHSHDQVRKAMGF